MSLDTASFLTPDIDQQAEDRRLFVKFTMEPVLDNAASAAAERPIYKDREFVTILVPGDKLLTFKAKVDNTHRIRFPVQYAAFKNSQGEILEGTPLAGWPHITDGQRKELEYFNIRTVEHLADANDASAGAMMGIQSLKQSAKRFLQDQKDKAPTIRLEKELAERDAQLAAQQAQIEDLASKLEGLLKKQAKG